MERNTAAWSTQLPVLAIAAVLMWLMACLSLAGGSSVMQRVTAQAGMIVGKLSLDEYMPSPGDTVKVTANVINPGKFTTTFPVVLEVGGKIARTTYVTLSGGISQAVNFTLRAGPVGTYLVKIGERSRAMLVVDPR